MMRRREFLKAATLGGAIGVTRAIGGPADPPVPASSPSPAPAPAGVDPRVDSRVEMTPEFDLLIRGGTVLDGTGGPAYPADVAVAGGRIVDIGTIPPGRARRVIDATALQVAPGFIDIHTHSDGTILDHPLAESRVLQGCTTEVTGNCGSSGALAPEPGKEPGPGTEPTGGAANFFARIREQGMSLNQALLAGHGTLRLAVGGDGNRPLDADQTRRMERLLDRALDEGCIGLSSGLEYDPGRFSPPEELRSLARLVARRGMLYATHLRNEVLLLVSAVDEAITLARETGARVQISHLKACGRASWPLLDQAIERIESARAGGLSVLADTYPYIAYSTSLTILLPKDVVEGDTSAMLARLRDPALRGRLLSELAAAVAIEPGGFELMVLSGTDGTAHLEQVGRNLAEIAASWKVAPAEAMLRLIEDTGGDAGYIGYAMSEANMVRTLAHPLVMVGSDGRSLSLERDPSGDSPHPRSFGTFPRVLGRYCRDEKRLPLPEAIRKMTAMPADQAGLAARGRIAKGQHADIVIFNAEKIADTATFEHPRRAPDGIVHTIVNGVAVVSLGRHTGARPGKLLA